MGFMEQEIHGPEDGWRVETTAGTWYVPGFVESDRDSLAGYVEGEIQDPQEDIQPVRGFFGRMSAPGYLDCTDWTFGETEEDVRDELTEYYGDEGDEEDEEESEEA